MPIEKFSPEKKLPSENLPEKQDKEDIEKRERLEVNPFPEILTSEEFFEAKKEGKNFLERYIEKREMAINEALNVDYFWTAYLNRKDLEVIENKIVEGKITEDYSQTVVSDARTVMGTQEIGKREIVQKVFEKIELVNPKWDEKLTSDEIFNCYQKDPSGKNIIDYIACKKAYRTAEKIDPSLSRDIIATDTGVFVKSDIEKPIESPDKNSKESIKPTHIWMKKPETKEEMKQMLESIAPAKQILMFF